jgi:hypothetical protein
MKTNIRELAEKHLGTTLEGGGGGFRLPVVLIDDLGVKYGADPAYPLYGQVLYDQKRVNPDTGEDIIIREPVVVLRISTLQSFGRIPEPGENWVVSFPLTPNEDAPLVEHTQSPTRSIERNDSIGFIRMYPQKAEQS